MDNNQTNHCPRKKIGLALGGGGAKGLAHIGVIKALEEEDIPIDFIAGTSMGALVGGWYAATKNIQFLENIFLKIKEKDLISGEGAKSLDSRLLFKSEIFAKMLIGILDDKKIEQCLIPFRAMATNVEDGQEEILSEGSLVDAIRASIALPIVFQPVKIGERLLMDGGVANPVPADVARKMGAEFILAIDVSSRWVRLDNDLAGRQKTLSLLVGAFAVVEYEVARQVLKQADLIIRPAVMTYEWLDFYRAKDIIEAGYRETKRQMNEIREKAGCPKKTPKTIMEKISDFLGDQRL